MFKKLYRRCLIRKFKRAGLQIADDCRIMGIPYFGTEPYLISIGKHVTISWDVRFITHDGATWLFRDRPEYRKVVKYGRITIHDNCFIGAGSTILPGVSIGPNAVVAAGSTVVKDVPPGSVYGGVPAKFIMTVDEYAAKCAANTIDYDEARYRTNKRAELLKFFPYPW